MAHRTLVAVLALLPALGLAQVTYVNDPLTAGSFAGRGGSRGGSFSATGWTTVNEPDAVWYEIADALPSARIEYTVTGISTGPGGTLSGVDHDIFTMYQAPVGYPEPVSYTPTFRNNDFKAFTRIFGINEPGREGAMKLELAACPRGDPWFHDTACPAGCENSGIAYANGVTTNVGWNAATSYRMAVEWGNGQMTFSRDGTVLGTVSYTGTYAPQPLRIRFGSPRHDNVYPGAAMMPIGITFRDVLITGTAGNRTLACGQVQPPDAGTPPGNDGGMTNQVFPVLADVTAASFTGGVFPDVFDLNVEGSGTAASGIVYLRFPAIPGVVTKARLRVHATTSASAGGGSGTVCAVADNSWSETAMTWATRPSYGSCAGALTNVVPDTDVEWDVTAIARSGVVQSLAIVSTDPDGAHFMSKELNAAKAPQLIVDFTPGGTGGGAGGGQAGGSGGGSGGGAGGGAGGGSGGGSGGAGGSGGGSVGVDAGHSSDAGTPDGGSGQTRTEIASGCGCTSAGAAPLIWLALGLVAAGRRRFRAGRRAT